MFEGLNMGDLMKQAQKLQEQFQKTQEELANAEVVGEAGAGLVQVIMNGRHDVKKVTIDPAVLSEEKEMLEDLLAAAVNDAVRKIESANKDKISGFTQGFNMPPGFNPANFK